ncbi:MAG: LysM peptidoglycan-binding domain-containing protein [Caldilineaceae bacterium]
MIPWNTFYTHARKWTFKLLIVAFVLSFTMLGVAPAQPAIAATESAPASHGYCVAWHYVTYGQTLSGIAAYYGVNYWHLANANGIGNPNRIYVGQQLCIPQGGGYGHGGYGQGGYYTVRYGDTLANIAYRNGVSVWRLAQINGIQNINYIYVGQKIRIW